MSDPNHRRTKIVCTLGPSSASEPVLLEMIEQGMDIARINFSHITGDDFLRYCDLVRTCAKKVGKEIGILADLQGPKIRIGAFSEGWVNLQENQDFCLDLDHNPKKGDRNRVFIQYEDLPKCVKKGDVLILDDGCIDMKVLEVCERQIYCRVITGGFLGSAKGLNRLGGGLSGSALTDKDKKDIGYAVRGSVDFLAVSFVSKPEELHLARSIYRKLKGEGDIIVKIEKAEALDQLNAIIDAADAVMIARGDLAIEVGDPALLGIQTRIINTCKACSKPVITATQMMYSMIENPTPTRAEVLDVANAVLDGTDAVCMSNETAVGRYPVRVVSSVQQICIGAERQEGRRDDLYSSSRLSSFQSHVEAIAYVAGLLARGRSIRSIVTLTESGATARFIASLTGQIPIYGLTRFLQTQRRMTLYRGVYPIYFDLMQHYQPSEKDSIEKGVIQLLLEKGFVKKGDCILLTSGSFIGTAGGTNCVKILDIN